MPNRGSNEELETALMDASIMAEITVEWFASCLGFEGRSTRPFDSREVAKAYWALNTVADMAAKAENIFQGREVA